MADSKKKKEIIEWVIIVSIGVFLYFTGYHTTVIGFVQRAILSTGIITPDIDSTSDIDASYNLNLVDIHGESVSMAEFKGKTIFINFWATWCPPCIAEMPDINSLYEETKNDVVFLIISVDENRDKAITFVNNKEFTFPIYFPNSAVPKSLKSNTIPTTLVISPSGKIVAKREGMAKYDTEEFKKFLRNL